jgi:hypothetical protein
MGQEVKTMLSVGVERRKARVNWGRPASVGAVVLGAIGPSSPVVEVRPGLAEQWLQIVATSDDRRNLVFDPSLGDRRPRPGSYRVAVVAQHQGERAGAAIVFEVPSQPCLQIGPNPTLTWNAVTGTATLNVALCNRGNVGLDVGWSVRVDRQRVSVEPATVALAADARWVSSSITFSVPGGLDADTEVDVHTLSPAGPQPVLSRRRGWLRRRRRVLVGRVASVG